MARSRWKQIYFDKFTWKQIKIYKKYSLKNFEIVIKNRRTSIAEAFTGNDAKIFKGKNFRMLNIDTNKQGMKFSEFAFTRKPFYYPMKKSNKKNNVLLRR